MYQLTRQSKLDWVYNKKIFNSFTDLLDNFPKNKHNILNTLYKTNVEICLIELNYISEQDFSTKCINFLQNYYYCIDSNNSNKFGFIMYDNNDYSMYIFNYFVRNPETHKISTKFVVFGNENPEDLICKYTDKHYNTSLFDNRNYNQVLLYNNHIVILTIHRDYYKFNQQLLCYDIEKQICWLIGLNNVLIKQIFDEKYKLKYNKITLDSYNFNFDYTIEKQSY